MVCETFHQGNSIIHRLDPRVRIVVAIAFSLVIAVSRRFPAVGAGLALGLLLALAARLPLVATLKRLIPLNLFMLVLLAVLPLTTPGSVLVQVGPLSASKAGLLLAAAVTVKGNAILLCLTALLATMEIVTLGHALGHLWVPEKLTHLLLFTVRYLDLLHHEYSRLAGAMKVRCFRARMNAHTYRTVAWLVGMLLVRSLDRSERIVAAMKCRGFRGRFYVLEHFAFAGRDAAFGALSLLVLLALIWVEHS